MFVATFCHNRSYQRFFGVGKPLDWWVEGLRCFLVYQGVLMDTIDPSTGLVWIPEFEGQRPPFQPGNTLAVTHGAYSSKRVDPVARRYIDELAQDAGLEYLQAPRFHAALWAWATAMARVELLGEWVDSMPIQDAADSDRGSTSALELHRKWMATAQTAAARLGLDPLSAARLGKDIAGTRQADAATLLTRRRAEAEGTP